MNKRALARRASDEARGIDHGLTDRERVRAHLQMLVDLGCSHASIAAARGHTGQTVTNILNRDRHTLMRGATAHRWLSLTVAAIFEHAPDGALVPSIPSRRRYEALRALGWRQSDIVERAMVMNGTDLSPGHFASDRRVSAQRHRTMAAIYTELETTPGPSARARAIALNRGYLPPAAWDDIDDLDEDPTATAPAAEPDWVAVERALTGRPVALTPTERDEAIRIGLARHMTSWDLADVLGMQPSAVQQRIKRKQLRQEVAA